MADMTCAICGQPTRSVFSQLLLNRHEVQYFSCEHCGFLQTEKPYWLDEAYAHAIADADTGLVQRNLIISRRLAALLLLLFGREGRYADLAGGTGLLVRLMRDIGFDFYWHDPYSRNIHARGFEYLEGTGSCRAVTAFEVLEHLEDPMPFVTEAMQRTGADTFIFSTELFAGEPPSSDQWWYYAPETGQHIAFYQRKTLQAMADRLGLRLYSASGMHMFTARKISPWRYRLAVASLSGLLLPILRRFMTSKIMTDHALMLKAGKD